MLYHGLKTYSLIDKVICPSEFLEKKLLSKPVFRGKTVMMHNFIQKLGKDMPVKKGNYVLYFGRFSREKGIHTLVKACRRLAEIPFIFIGGGPLEYLIKDIQNIKNMGFQRGDDLFKIVSEALFSVFPSECYENCPFSVMESQMYGTPVIATDIGGIPELLKNGYTGLFFQPGNEDELTEKISALWNNRNLLEELTKNCLKTEFDSPDIYGQKLLDLYRQTMNKE